MDVNCSSFANQKYIFIYKKKETLFHSSQFPIYTDSTQWNGVVFGANKKCVLSCAIVKMRETKGNKWFWNRIMF